MPTVSKELESDIEGVIFGTKICQENYKEIMGIELTPNCLPLFFDRLDDGIYKLKVDLKRLKKKFSEMYIFNELKKLREIRNKDERSQYFKKEILPLVKRL